MPEWTRTLKAGLATAALLVGWATQASPVAAQQPPDRKVAEGGEPCVALVVNAAFLLIWRWPYALNNSLRKRR